MSQGWSLGGCRYQPQGAGWGPGSGTQNESDASAHLSSADQRENVFLAIILKLEAQNDRRNQGNEYFNVTQQESSMTSGSSSPPTSKTSPVQALNRTDPCVAVRSSADLQTEVFRQWMVMCCTASELNRCRKFNWTRPALKAGCSERQDKCC